MTADTSHLPPLPPVDIHAKLSPAAKTVLRECFNRFLAHNKKPGSGTFPPDAVEQLVRAVENMTVDTMDEYEAVNVSMHAVGHDELLPFVAHPDLNFVHVLRWLLLIHVRPKGSKPDEWWFYHARDGLKIYFERLGDNVPGLRELGRVLAAINFPPEFLASWYLRRSSRTAYTTVLADLPPEKVWPFYVDKLYLLEAAFQEKESYFMNAEKELAYEVFHLFPEPPPRLVDKIWEVALSGNKKNRLLARENLGDDEAVRARVQGRLASGRAEERAIAAEWLAELNATEAIPALKAAFLKEKNEATKGELLTALEKLRHPVEEFLDPERLQKEAEKGLAKGFEKELSWLAADFPELLWAVDATKVEPHVLRWFVFNTIKLKLPEPGPLLRLYASQMEEKSRHRFAHWLLESWITYDTMPRNAEEIEAYMKEWRGKWSALGITLHEENARRQATSEPGGSAIAMKGALAVVGAMAGPEIVPPIQSYLKTWYGMRAAQCKALLQMLVWVDDPAAIQLLLTIGRRFRTKGIREEADLQTRKLALRKGWTLDELADRTLATGGFDEMGKLELDYGDRLFTAMLDEKLAITLLHGGEKIKALPDAAKRDDPAKVDEAKKHFADARKGVKIVVKLQTQRLYEAMCIDRHWTFEDWSSLLLRHPIVGRLCERLVWRVVEGAYAGITFRPLSDRTLTSVDDAALNLDSVAQIGIAHGSHSTSQEAEKWTRHFLDYEVSPLFHQFGRSRYEIKDGTLTEMADFEGHLLKAFDLRNQATKLGYTRGETADGGRFFDYEKFLPGANLRIHLKFSGNSLPENNQVVALERLTIMRSDPETGYAKILSVSEVPPVLLAECWNDLRLIAATGTGFDPAWKGIGR